jgi:CBS domain-containing protein
MSSIRRPEEIPTVRIHTLRTLIARSETVTVRRTTRLEDIRCRLLEHDVSIVAVIDGDVLCGTISAVDVLRALGSEGAVAADIMSTPSIGLAAESDVDSAAIVMASEGVEHVIVVGARGELVGIVSAIDIARHHAVCAGYSKRGEAA